MSCVFSTDFNKIDKNGKNVFACALTLKEGMKIKFTFPAGAWGSAGEINGEVTAVVQDFGTFFRLDILYDTPSCAILINHEPFYQVGNGIPYSICFDVD